MQRNLKEPNIECLISLVPSHKNDKEPSYLQEDQDKTLLTFLFV